jgi:hypothetical protein
VASLATPRISLTSGGILCIGAVGLVCLAFPSFTAYLSPAPDATAIPPDG